MLNELKKHVDYHIADEYSYQCPYCSFISLGVKSLKSHLDTHKKEKCKKPYRCMECNFSSEFLCLLKRHLQYHGECMYQCPHCSYAAFNIRRLKQHLEYHSGKFSYQCPHCTYACCNNQVFKEHIRTHTGEKPYECNICSVCFASFSSFSKHKKIAHSENKPSFPCNLCPAVLSSKRSMYIHKQNIHYSKKPLECKRCVKTFPDVYTYKLHAKTHKGEKCFKCTFCSFASTEQYHVVKHIIKHTGRNPCSCDVCGKKFIGQELLRRHKNHRHVTSKQEGKRKNCLSSIKAFKPNDVVDDLKVDTNHSCLGVKTIPSPVVMLERLSDDILKAYQIIPDESLEKCAPH